MKYLYWVHPSNYQTIKDWIFSFSDYENYYPPRKGFTILGFEFQEQPKTFIYGRNNTIYGTQLLNIEIDKNSGEIVSVWFKIPCVFIPTSGSG